MSSNTRTPSAALFFSVASFGHANALEASAADNNQQAFNVLAVVAAAYHDSRVATNAVEVRRQGGFGITAAINWNGKYEQTSQASVIDFPSVIGAAYHDRNIATNAVEVRRQGGFATPAAVQWLPVAPAESDAKSEQIRLGAL